jgi:predicted transposase YbfD/YdcC
MNSENKLVSIFTHIDDHRSHINRLHHLGDILLIGIISVICGAETWKQMVGFAKAKEAFLKRFLELPNGIPSEDTFNRVFTGIDSTQFEQCFMDWVNTLCQHSKKGIIAIDGKTLRGAKKKGVKSAIHMVSAWSCANNLVLGQVKVSDKSNEITAIPELLELLYLKDAVITIDAMGCQTDIAKKIIDDQSNYILAVKANQQSLLDDIQDSFTFSNQSTSSTTVEGDHGRIETRVCSVINSLKHLRASEKWSGIKSLVKIENKRVFKNSDKPTEESIRYYISSCEETPKFFQQSIRSHWAIENKLHWTLDVAFGEDASRKRTGNAAQNYSVLLKIALNLLKNEKTEKQGIKGKRLKAAWNEDYLAKLLNLKV